VDDAVAVALEVEAETVLVLGMNAPARGGAGLGIGGEVAGFAPLQIKTASRHPSNLSLHGA
jgi:hypothetical protein